MDQTTDTLPTPSAETIEDRLDGLNTRIDMLGQQMNWLCENMQGLFQFIAAIGQQGGGIRGLMSAMKNAPKEMQVTDLPEVINE